MGDLRYALLMAVTAALSLQAGPISFTPPPGLQVTTFASGLSFPAGLTRLADGSLLAGTTASAGGTGFTAYYLGSGELVRFTDINHVGVADGAGTVVASGLPGAVTAVRQVGDVIAVATTGNGTFAGLSDGDITFLRPGATPTTPYTNLGSIHIHFPNADAAINLTLDARPTPGSPGQYDLFFATGAGNHTGIPTTNVVASGLVSASLPTGSLYKLTVKPDTLTFSAPVQVANGIRNTGGILINPATGDVYFGDNGYENGTTPVSADELNLLTAAQIASGNVTTFGYPGSYTDYQTGAFVGSTGDPALISFLRNASAGTDRFGINELAFAPSAFPAGLNNGIFSGFFGDFNQAGTGNTSNPVVYYDFASGTYTDFIGAGQPGVGHLSSLLSTSDALFLADFSSANGFTAGSGVIYQLTAATPEPTTGVVVLAGIGFLAGLRWRLSRVIRL